jgi:hypothetical protein
MGDSRSPMHLPSPYIAQSGCIRLQRCGAGGQSGRWNRLLHGGSHGLPCGILVRISLKPVTFVCNAAALVAKASDGIRCCMGDHAYVSSHAPS